MYDWFAQIAPPQNVTGTVLTTYVLFDVFLIIVLARILGTLMTKIGQPRVIGEILAGVLVGPTLIGKNLSLAIAPIEARPVLNTFATMALAMFMFLAGVEYDQSKVIGRVKQAGIIALLAVVIPALFGFPVAKAMYSPVYVGEGANELLPFALFIGAALSVTAFPVMAHILMERGELNSKIGSLAVASTAIMSVFMFGYLAFAEAIVAAHGFADFVFKGVLILSFIMISWLVVRPLLPRSLPGDKILADGMAICLAGMTLYALISHQLGVNAMIGGFLWGMILPINLSLRASISAKMKDLVLIFFMPLFFAIAGFQADLKLITINTLPIVCLMLLAAISAKFFAAASSRVFGASWSEAGFLGALFNTRGLLVLVVGLAGLQFKIITNLTYSIILVVALVTNLMTLPLLNLFAENHQQVALSSKSPEH